MSMIANGLKAPDPANTLETALAALEAANIDSDCDGDGGSGTSDVQELKNGRDPNPPGEFIDPAMSGPPEGDMGCTNASASPSFGCGAQLARAPASWPGAAALAAALGLALYRRRRKHTASGSLAKHTASGSLAKHTASGSLAKLPASGSLAKLFACGSLAKK
jgi:MYXO-CTERM domain-containing protein